MDPGRVSYGPACGGQSNGRKSYDPNNGATQIVRLARSFGRQVVVGGTMR